MSGIPYAPVTCVDTATSLGANDGTIVGLDYRWAGEVNNVVTFVGTLTSIGAADSCRLQVSPDYDIRGGAVNTGAMWQTIEVFTTTAFNGALQGPWAAFRFIKPGDQTCKVVALVAGGQRSRYNAQG